jgi:hypothetical protein
LGFGVGVLGLGVWGMGPTPHSPIPNPQSPIPNELLKININKYQILNNNLNINKNLF